MSANLRPKASQNLFGGRGVSLLFEICLAHTFKDGAGGGHCSCGIAFNRLVRPIVVNFDDLDSSRLDALSERLRRTSQHCTQNEPASLVAEALLGQYRMDPVARIRRSVC